MIAPQSKNLLSPTEPLFPLSDNLKQFEIELTLPQLIGSVKQINWGRKIRWEILSVIIPQMMDWLPENTDDRKDYLDICLKIRNHTSAHWWIDFRLVPPKELVFGWIKEMQDERRNAKLKAERLEKTRQESSQRMKDFHAMKKWERVNALPVLTGVSKEQINYGRRSRYEQCKDGLNLKAKTETNSIYWIIKSKELQESPY